MKEDWKDNEDLVKQNRLLLDNEAVQDQFKGYYFDINAMQQGSPNKDTTHSTAAASSQNTADTGVVNR